MPYAPKYEQGTERMSLRVPTDVKNHIWHRADKTKTSATDVVVAILRQAFKGQPPAPQWTPSKLRDLAMEVQARMPDASGVGTKRARRRRLNGEGIFG